MAPHEIALFVRSSAQLDRAVAVAENSGLPFTFLDKVLNLVSGKVSIATMRLAKRLEFRFVAVMACEDEILPLQVGFRT